MATISPWMATLLTVHPLTQPPLSATLHAAAQTGGMTGLIAVIAIGGVIAALGHVARALGALMTALLQAAVAVMFALFVTTLGAFVLLVLLLHL